MMPTPKDRWKKAGAVRGATGIESSLGRPTRRKNVKGTGTGMLEPNTSRDRLRHVALEIGWPTRWLTKNNRPKDRDPIPPHTARWPQSLGFGVWGAKNNELFSVKWGRISTTKFQNKQKWSECFPTTMNESTSILSCPSQTTTYQNHQHIRKTRLLLPVARKVKLPFRW